VSLLSSRTPELFAGKLAAKSIAIALSMKLLESGFWQAVTRSGHFQLN